MRWTYDNHGLHRTVWSHHHRVLNGTARIDGDGDIIVVISGRNVDDDRFREWIAVS
jgi:threonine dehydratase